MTTEQTIVAHELDTLAKDLDNAIQMFLDFLNSAITDIPPETMQKVTAAAQLIDDARKEYRAIVKMRGGTA